MSGTIAISPDMRWSAASWLFDWTVEFLAKDVGDANAAEHLREIVAVNIGWLSLEDLSNDTRARLLHRLRIELVDTAERTLPATLASRPAVLEHLRELAQLAERASAGEAAEPSQRAP